MGLIANSAFSRSWIIRLSEAYTSMSFPFAFEMVEEKVVSLVRTSQLLRIEGTRFTLEGIQEKENNIKVHANHILGWGLTVSILKKGEYETEVQVIICSNNLRRNIKMEESLVSELKLHLFSKFES